MTDYRQQIEVLRDLADELFHAIAFQRANLYYGDISPVLVRLASIVDTRFCGSAYAHEKLSEARWSFAAMADLDEGNGHRSDQHRAWARQALQSLGDELDRRESEGFQG